MRLPQTRREKEIWHACEILWQEHADLKKLTGDAIRSQLLNLHYKKGSPNEVYRYRKTWQETRGVPDISKETATALSAPELPDPINRAVSLVRDEIFSEAQKTIEKMTEDFNIEREGHKKEIQALQEQLHQEQLCQQQLQEKIKNLDAVCQAQNQDKCLLKEEIQTLNEENKQLEKKLSEKTHEQALTLERLQQGEKKIELLIDAAEKQVQTITQTMTTHQENLMKQVEAQHQAQISQYQEAQLTLKDLMETQRHQWIKQLDAEKTAHKKVQLENNKIAQLLEQSTQEIMTLKEKSIQYETLMEIQQLQANLLSSLSEEVHNLEKTISLDKIAAIFENKTKGVSHHLSGALQTHFQKQNEWLQNLLHEQ